MFLPEKLTEKLYLESFSSEENSTNKIKQNFRFIFFCQINDNF